MDFFVRLIDLNSTSRESAIACRVNGAMLPAKLACTNTSTGADGEVSVSLIATRQGENSDTTHLSITRSQSSA